MTKSDGSSAPAPRGVQSLPPRPDLEHLKNQAKRRLDELRRSDPHAKLADAQYAIATEYGFPSWRALKAQVDVLNQRTDALLAAVESGDVATLDRLLREAPALVNAAVRDRGVRELPTDTRAMRLLHVAVAADQIEAARVLIDRGADMGVRNADGRTPLHDALELGRFGIEALLRERGVDVDICSAAICGEMDVVREWLDRDPALANDRSTNLTPVGWASFGGRIEVIRLLVERGAGLDASETLWPAAQTGRTGLAKALIGMGVDVRAPAGPKQRTALHACAMMNYTDDASGVARLLLDAGADASVRDRDGATPAEMALSAWARAIENGGAGRRRYDRVLDVLAEHGGIEPRDEERRARLLAQSGAADAHDEDRMNESSGQAQQTVEISDEQVVEAVQTGDLLTLRAILDKDPEKIRLTGGTWDKPLLHNAAWEGHLNIVDELLERGFDVNTRCGSDNAYAMHFAAERGFFEIVKRLADAGGDIHGDGDDHEMGVLGWATCLSGYHEDIAAYLMEHGAKLHIFSAIALNRGGDVRRMVGDDPTQLERKMSRNEHRRRPLHHAADKNRPEMVRLLLDLGADATAADDSGATPMSYASDPAVVEMLTGAGAAINLLGALGAGRYDLAESLLGDDPARLGPDGQDAVTLHLMASRKKPDAVRWLVDHGADVNAKRELWGCNHTALHVCCENGNAEIARILLDAGANPTIRDDKFDSDALGWAEYLKQPEVAQVIRESMA